MKLVDAVRARIRRMKFDQGTPSQIAQRRDDLADIRANLAIEGIPLDAEDDALFEMMVEEGVSPALMVTLIADLYRQGIH